MAVVLHVEADKGHYRITIELAVRKYRSNTRVVLAAVNKVREALALAFPHKEE